MKTIKTGVLKQVNSVLRIVEEEYNIIDKSKFPKGEWMMEPDRIKLFEDLRYPCMIRRNTMGNLCGYVGVWEGHELYGTSEDYLDSTLYINVHGGLTFKGHIDSHFTWYWGFDCGHARDYIPMMGGVFTTSDQASYRNISYVIRETIKLYKQIKAYDHRSKYSHEEYKSQRNRFP